jgi:DNA-binding NarL/FixJ family response regulator
MAARVLLVDDNIDFIERVTEIVREKFEVVGQCYDSLQLVTLVRETQPDILIADLSMPSIGGFQILQVLRREAIQVKVIFLTMHEDPTMVEHAIQQGAAGYVLKNRAARELLPAIESALQAKFYGPTGKRG